MKKVLFIYILSLIVIILLPNNVKSEFVESVNSGSPSSFSEAGFADFQFGDVVYESHYRDEAGTLQHFKIICNPSSATCYYLCNDGKEIHWFTIYQGGNPSAPGIHFEYIRVQ